MLVNGKTSAGSTYRIYEVLSAGGPSFLDTGPFALPASKSPTPDIDVTPAAWDSDETKDHCLALSPNGNIYAFYSGNAGGAIETGVAERGAGGGYTKGSNNPIFPTGDVGEPTGGQFFPSAVWDVLDNQWVCIMTVFNSGNHELHLYTCPDEDPDSANWEWQGQVVDHGSGGDWDALGAANPSILWYKGEWQVWYSGLSNSTPQGNGWGIGRVIGSDDLLSLTKDSNNPIWAKETGPETTTTAATTDGTDLTVSSTTGFVADALVVTTDDNTAANSLLCRIREVVDSVTLRMYDHVTVSNGEKIWQFDAESSVNTSIVATPSGVDAYTVLMTPFRWAIRDAALSTAYESTGMATLDHIDTSGAAPTLSFSWEDTFGGVVAPAPSSLMIAAGDQASWENPVTVIPMIEEKEIHVSAVCDAVLVNPTPVYLIVNKRIHPIFRI